jgi:hypothetical protein
MGCSGSNTKDIYNYLPKISHGKKRLSIEEERRKYNTHHENFENLMLDYEIRNSFFNSEKHGFLQFFEQFYGMYKFKFEQYNMSYYEVKDVILEKLVESQMKDDLLIREWDVADFISTTFAEQPELNEDQAESARNFLITSGRYFPAKQKGCYVAVNNLENIQKWGLKPYLTNLKFNAGFQMQNLNIVLSPFIFHHEENIFDLCEVIDSNLDLLTLSITIAKINDNLDSGEKFLNNYTPETQHLDSIKYLLQGVKFHPGVKFFSFGNYANYQYNLGKEITDELVKLLSADKFYSFCLMKLGNISHELMREVIYLIGHSNNLKFFILDMNFTKEDLKAVKDAVVRNKKLIGGFISCGGGNFSEFKGDFCELRDEIKKENSNLKFFEIVKEFKFQK